MEALPARRRLPLTTIRLNTENSADIFHSENFWNNAATAAVIGLFGLLFVAFLYLAKPLLVPLISAAVLSATFGPLANRAARYRVPAPLFALLCVAFVIVVVNAVLILVGGAIANWADSAPEIAASLKAKIEVLDRPIAAIRRIQEALTSLLGSNSEPLKLDLPAAAILSPLVTFLTPAVGELVVFIGSMFFFLLRRNRQRQFFVTFFRTQEARLRILRILNDIEQNFTRYVVSVTIINIFVGLAAGIIAYVSGLPNPVSLGMLAFLMNYIPYLGPAMVALTLFVVGLIALPTLYAAALAPALFVGFATIEGHFLTPAVLGKQLMVSPLAIFLSLAFWTWLWGPIGTFLATPILIALVMIREHIRPVAAVPLPE